MALDSRKETVLRAIVQDYIDTAEPVGSNVLTQRHALGYCAASVRSVMAELESLGYLYQPHTSAGRIPTDKGYRFFVDFLMGKERLTAQERHEIRTNLEAYTSEIETFIERVAKTLASISHCASMILVPRLRRFFLKSLQLVPIEDDKALLVMVTSSGHIINKLIEAPGCIQEDLPRLSAMLNERFSGIPLEQLTYARVESLVGELMGSVYSGILKELLPLIASSAGQELGDKVASEGALGLLAQPEFRDVGKVKRLLELLEDRRPISAVLTHQMSTAGLRVVIGGENPYREMQDYSLITATYRMDDQVVGSLGILGPTRMHYSKLVSLVRYIAHCLSEKLTPLGKR
ncbi:MAG: heat-inducible transcription repressor HrcA [Armatimonadetes bacterium]|nr:heat-inducible transcription repressor HrcA [Armatimonadota bacterium]